MSKQKTYSREFKLQMVHMLAKGTHNISQISRDYHMTRSLLYGWMRLYQERGEAAFIRDRAIDALTEVEWKDACGRASRASRTVVWKTSARNRSLTFGGGPIKKGPGTSFHSYRDMR